MINCCFRHSVCEFAALPCPPLGRLSSVSLRRRPPKGCTTDPHNVVQVRSYCEVKHFLVFWLGVRTQNAGVASSNPTYVKIKSCWWEKAIGSHLKKIHFPRNNCAVLEAFHLVILTRKSNLEIPDIISIISFCKIPCKVSPCNGHNLMLCVLPLVKNVQRGNLYWKADDLLVSIKLDCKYLMFSDLYCVNVFYPRLRFYRSLSKVRINLWMWPRATLLFSIASSRPLHVQRKS